MVEHKLLRFVPDCLDLLLLLLLPRFTITGRSAAAPKVKEGTRAKTDHVSSPCRQLPPARRRSQSVGDALTAAIEADIPAAARSRTAPVARLPASPGRPSWTAPAVHPGEPRPPVLDTAPAARPGHSPGRPPGRSAARPSWAAPAARLGQSPGRPSCTQPRPPVLNSPGRSSWTQPRPPIPDTAPVARSGQPPAADHPRADPATDARSTDGRYVVTTAVRTKKNITPPLRWKKPASDDGESDPPRRGRTKSLSSRHNAKQFGMLWYVI